uniref:Uncharacterized protein n=1 Tax=Anguilla anguilla TaxID=7936 RepID=A0A0E9V3N4_ANGAN
MFYTDEDVWHMSSATHHAWTLVNPDRNVTECIQPQLLAYFNI